MVEPVVGTSATQTVAGELVSVEDPALAHDSSTDALIERFRRARRGMG